MMKPNFMDKLLDGVEVEWKSLEEVFDILAGGDVPKDALSDIKTEEFSIPILSNGIDERSLYGWTNKAKIVDPSLTISARGTIGWTSLRDKPFFPIVRLLVLTPKIELNLKYAYHFMKMIENDYIAPKTGIPQLTKPMIKDIKIPFPCLDNTKKSLEIQTEIVRILDAFTELTAELTAELTSELTARKKQYTYYRDQLLTFEEGEIEWKALGEVCSIGVGKNPNDTGIGEYSFVNAGTTPSGYLSNFNTEPDTITTPSRGQGGIGFVGYQNRHFWCGPLCYRIRSTNNNIKTRFIYYVMTNSMADIIGLANMTGVPALNRKELTGFKIPIPSVTEQERIVSILDKFDALTSSITQGLPREIELRQKQYEYYRNMLLSFPKVEV